MKSQSVVPIRPVVAITADDVLIRRPEDIRPAAVALKTFADRIALRVGACADIASKDSMIDADGAVINA